MNRVPFCYIIDLQGSIVYRGGLGGPLYADKLSAVLEGKVPLSPSQRQRILQEQPILRQIAAKNRTVKQKRKVLTSQRGGNIISFLFNVLKSIF